MPDKKYILQGYSDTLVIRYPESGIGYKPAGTFAAIRQLE